jgi:hypothetical protein
VTGDLSERHPVSPLPDNGCLSAIAFFTLSSMWPDRSLLRHVDRRCGTVVALTPSGASLPRRFP